MASEKLQVILELIAGQYKREAKEAASATGRIGDAASGAGRNIAVALGGALVAVGVTALKSLARIETIGAQTDAVLASTAGAANVTRSEIDDLAKALENLSGIEAEGITEGQNLLLTFTNIRNTVDTPVFDLATKAMVDMSVAMGTDVSGGAIQLGKALNDPIKGITALTRVGVTFSDEQKKMIKALVETGDIAGAQMVIIAELNKEFGGSAEALGNTLQGRIDKVKNKFGDLTEKLVSGLLPAIEDTVDAVGPLLDVLGEVANFEVTINGEGVNIFGQVVGATVTPIFNVIGKLGELGTAVDEAVQKMIFGSDVVDESHDSWMNIAEAIGEVHDSWENVPGALAPVIELLKHEATAHGNAAQKASDQRDALINLNNTMLGLLDPVANVIQLNKDYKKAQEELTSVLADSEATDEDKALAVLEVESAFLRLQAAGADLTPEQIQAFAQVLMTELGMSEAQALDTLAALDLLDGWTGSATFSLNMINNLENAIGESVSNTRVQPRQHGGPVSAGRPYMVGERGPELMVPHQSGSIMPNGWNRPNSTIVIQSPMNDFAQDLQLATILATVNTMVEVQG